MNQWESEKDVEAAENNQEALMRKEAGRLSQQQTGRTNIEI